MPAIDVVIVILLFHHCQHYQKQIAWKLIIFNTLLFCASTLQAAFGTMDYIIDTVSAVHALAPLLGLLKVNGKLVTVGLPEKPLELPIFPLVMGKPQEALNAEHY